MLRTVRIKTLLVIEDGGVPKALTTDLVIRATTSRRQTRIQFLDPGRFHATVRRHVRQVILPIIDHVCSRLRLKRRNFSISVVNINLAASMGKAIQVSGFSADAPIFCGMLAAATYLTVPPEVVMTGHISSQEGDIRMVRHLTEKCRAAILNPEIARFFHPDMSGDDSLANVVSDEHLRVEAKIRGSQAKLRVYPVKNILELVQLVFEDRTDLLRANLQGGYFGLQTKGSSNSTHPLNAIIHYLLAPTTGDFFEELKRCLMQSRNDAAKSLLYDYVAFFLRRKKYPVGIGDGIKRVVLSLPPSIRRLKIQFPLLSQDLWQRFRKIAPAEHEQDAKLFNDAQSDSIPPVLPERRLPRSRRFLKPVEDRSADPDAATALEYLLEHFEEISLARHIEKELDQARASYTTDSVVVKSEGQFIETITGFWIHCTTNDTNSSSPIDTGTAKADAIALVEQAYGRQGGYSEALSQARNGTGGGLRSVFDTMIQELKMRKHKAHVMYHFRKAIDPSDSRARIGVMTAIMQRFPHIVPRELRRKPPEQFAKKSEEILMSLIENLKSLKRYTATR